MQGASSFNPNTQCPVSVYLCTLQGMTKLKTVIIVVETDSKIKVTSLFITWDMKETVGEESD